MKKKVFAICLAMVFIFTAFSVSFAATDTVTVSVDPSKVEQGSAFEIKGTSSLSTVLVTIYQGSGDNLKDKKYQVAVDVKNKSYTTGKITVPEGTTDWPTGTYSVFVGSGEVVAVKTFSVIAKKTTSDNSSSNDNIYVSETDGSILPPAEGSANADAIDNAINSEAAKLTITLINGAKVIIPASELVALNANKVVAGVAAASNDSYQTLVFVNNAAIKKFGAPITVRIPCPLDSSIDRRSVAIESNGVILPLSMYDQSTNEIVFMTNDISGNFKIVVNPVTFNDISQVEWAHEAILNLASKGIINGVGEGIYEPNRDVTRAEFVKMLVGALGIEVSGNDASFTDVNKDAWYAGFVAAAQKAGIVNGYEDGSFGVSKNITRQEMVTMIKRAADVVGLKLTEVRESITFSDDAMIANYAKDAVYSTYKAGIINGMGENVFAPTENTTRAQAAKAIFEVFKKLF